MPCSCRPKEKQIYYANLQLFTDAQQGSPTGASRILNMQQVLVCTKCGTAEFAIPQTERRWFRPPSFPTNRGEPPFNHHA